MNDSATPGVLLTSEDGSQYFIPHADLSQYAVRPPEEATADVTAAAPRVDAFSVSRTGSTEPGTAAYSPAESPVAFPPFPEN